MLACRGYVTVSRCAHEYQLPALFQLWPGKGTASQVQLAAELTELLVQAFPGREVHGAGDAALHGEAPGHQGHDLNHEAAGPARSSPGRTPPADRAARSAAGDRGADRQVQGRRRRGLARGDRPDLRQAAEGAGRRVPGTVARQLQGRSGPARPDARAGLGKPHDLGIFTRDTRLSAEAIERYSWRWPIEPSNATGKQVTAADMHAALREVLTSARINTISQRGGESRKTVTSTLTSEAQAA